MIRHTVLFRFNDDASAEQIEALRTATAALRHAIGGIVALRHGEELGGRAGGHTHVVEMEFADRAALEAFYDHPGHRQLVEGRIKPITAQILVADVAFEEDTAE